MHKIFFQAGSLTLYWYGMMVATGFFVGLWTASRRALRANLPPEHVLDLGPWLVGGAIIGSRVLYIVTFWRDYFSQQPWWEMLMIQHGGLVFYGGLIGAVLAGGWQIRRKKMPFWQVADVMAPSVALGHFFGRLGCFLNGCCYGYPTSCVLAVHFPNDHETGGIGVHPTQLYESCFNLVLSLGLAWFFPRRRYPGQVFALYLVFYAVGRGLVEMFRGDYKEYLLNGLLTPAQVVSAFLLVGGLTALWLLPRDVDAGNSTPKRNEA